MSDEREIALLRGESAFLARLGDELTRPVHPRKAHISYLPSQYLCELIKDCGFDGVAYRSSVSTGMNIALFDPGRATLGAIVQYEVKQVHVELGACQASAGEP
jgi:hypothetical protein